MNYISTRDASSQSHTYIEALLQGLASDGGLFVPANYPTISREDLEALRGASYRDIAFAIKRLFVDGDIPDSELNALVSSAYDKRLFVDAKDGNVTPVSYVKDSLFVQQLSLGPTAAFKDMAMQLLGQEMNYVLQGRGEHLVILGATSGDTGSAAEASFKDQANITLFMLSPEHGMSPFQKAQMGRLSGGNIFNISVRGKFDDCQDMVKQLKQEDEFKSLGAVNSINWGRISSQIPYYFSGYLQVAETVGKEIDFVVPSGNFGDVLSGYYAKQMGLPIRRLIVATNENTVLDTLFKTGKYTQTKTTTTSSPSMDISRASNYERLAFDLLVRDASKLADYMRAFESAGTVDLADYGVGVSAFQDIGIESGASTHADRLASIKDAYSASGMFIDPHTADAYTVALRSRKDDVPMVVLATALPVKFEETMRESLGFVPPRPDRFVDMEANLQSDAFVTIDADASQLRDILRARANIK